MSFDENHNIITPSVNTDFKTISFWMNPNNTYTGDDTRQILFADTNDTTYNIALGKYTEGVSGESFGISTGDETNAFSGTTETNYYANNWYHMVLRWNNNTDLYEIFVNGRKVPVTHDSGNGASLWSGIPIRIGERANDSENYSGLLDDVRIYDRSLSDDEVFQLYQWGTRGKNLKEAIDNYQSS